MAETHEFLQKFIRDQNKMLKLLISRNRFEQADKDRLEFLKRK